MSDSFTDGLNNPQNDEVTIDLKDFLALIRKHWIVILSMIFLASMLSLYVVIKSKPVYKSTTSLLIEKPDRMASLGGASGYQGMNWEFYPNQIHVLESTPVAKRAVEIIGVKKLIPKKQELKWYQKILPGQGSEEILEKSQDQIFLEVVGGLKGSMSVSQAKQSGVFYISFDDYDPYLATLKANALADSYIAEIIESSINAKQKTGESISRQLPELQRKVAESEVDLKTFQKENKIFLPEGGDELAVQELGQLNTRILELKRNKLTLQSVYQRIKSVSSQPAKLARVPALLEKPEVISQKDKYAKAQTNVSELGLVYGPKHPKMERAIETRRLAQKEYYSILQTTADLIISNYQTVVQEIAHEELGVSSIKVEISDNNELAFEYDTLKREFEYNKQIYDAFLKQSKQSEAVKTASVQTINARVLNKATVPSSPYKPNKKLMLAVGLILGLIIGLGLAFLIEYFDNTFKSSEEVEKKLNIPVIGMLPQVSEKDSDISPAMQFIETPKSAFSESIRTLRTGILLSMPDQDNKTLLVTSTVPSEGKTTIAMNLAHSLSHLGDTILIEADLRRPMVKTNMGRPNKKGLSSLITGESGFAECIAVDPRSKKLHILSSGVIPPNPLELLSSDKFEILLSKLKERYKFVIIDCAPVMAVSDALVLSQKVDGVLFVIKHEATPSQLVESAVTRLKRASAKIVGISLNMLKTNKARYGRYYKYQGNYYGHYGYHSDAESKDSKKSKQRA